jgi:tetratricopeptide (TPR) repeat protein
MTRTAWIVAVIGLAIAAGAAAIVGSRHTSSASDATRTASLSPSSAGASSTTSSEGAASRCDALAGHPEDPNRQAAGVADEDIMPEDAITACLAAIQQAPDNGRFHFELGRAYWADMEYEDALDSLLKAEALGYAPAYYYLGVAFEQGLTDEEPSDAAAREMYVLAASERFAPAVRAQSEESR